MFKVYDTRTKSNSTQRTGWQYVNVKLPNVNKFNVSIERNVKPDKKDNETRIEGALPKTELHYLTHIRRLMVPKTSFLTKVT